MSERVPIYGPLGNLTASNNKAFYPNPIESVAGGYHRSFNNNLPMSFQHNESFPPKLSAQHSNSKLQQQMQTTRVIALIVVRALTNSKGLKVNKWLRWMHLHISWGPCQHTSKSSSYRTLIASHHVVTSCRHRHRHQHLKKTITTCIRKLQLSVRYHLIMRIHPSHRIYASTYVITDRDHVNKSIVIKCTRK